MLSSVRPSRFSRRRLFVFGAFSLFFVPLLYFYHQLFLNTDEYPRFLIPIQTLLNESADFAISSIAAPKNCSRVAFISVLDSPNSLSEFHFALSTLHCFCRRNPNYSHILLFAKNAIVGKCSPINEFMFLRHCLVANWMRDHSEFEWILFLDADIGIVNPDRRIEQFIDGKENETELILLDRMFNFEIMAGTYLAKNTPFTRVFLYSWAFYAQRLPNSFHGSDNGAIHALIMDRYADSNAKQRCRHLWEVSRNFRDLFRFEACVRFHTNWTMRRESEYGGGTVKVVAKGQGWVRDGGLTGTRFSRRDFMLHGWKNSTFNRRTFNPWRNPFTADQRFDQNELCANVSVTWKHNLDLFIEDGDSVDKMLDGFVRKSESEYRETLTELKLI